MGYRGFAAGALLLVSSLFGVSANRRCGSGTTASSVRWTVTDWRFDGADPTKKDTYATISVALLPATPNTRFSCYGEWPEAWEGYYQGNGSLLWLDCLWTGPGNNADLTVTFGMDIKSKTAYLAHTYNCDEAASRGNTMVARGTVAVESDCKADSSGQKTCLAKTSRLTLDAKPEPARLTTTSACSDNSKREQSWIVESFKRSYPTSDNEASAPVSGPSFTMKSMVNSDVFTCTSPPSKGADTIVEGTCTGATGASSAKFLYDPKMIMLSVTQQWDCKDQGAAKFEATGVAYIQSSCLPTGDLKVCDLVDPFWLGGKLNKPS